MSKSELNAEKRVLESMIYKEKQRLISKDAPDLLRKQASYLRTLDYNLSKVHEAEKELDQQRKPSLAQIISRAEIHANSHNENSTFSSLQQQTDKQL